MRHRQIIGMGAMTALAAVLSACGASDAGLAQPPRAKPATLPVRLEGPTADTSILAGVSTKSGELLILENDGSVTRTKVDSDQGRQTLRQTDAAIFSLTDVLVEDTSVPLEDLPKPPRAQDIAIEEFAARRSTALPARIGRAPEDAFLGGAVVKIAQPGRKGGGDMVSVQVRLRQGVDESTAFAYATCTLAAWAKTSNTPYGRHIRTVFAEDGGVVSAESIFTMSKSTPLGLRVMEQEQTLQECRAHGIPARVAAVGPVKGTN
ncbi:MAG: hypothetical protein DI616_07210 [Paracoccus denitrificans]|uniref:Lipoprotein n=1 Tax=Paracoccus denitrificans TaxID=266 RepID=A0A533I9B4_PARDE|nr:MAG: hypothetical protein DI616_07210 [Paracoccus denitrificans]